MTLLKIITLQAFWFFAVILGPKIHPVWILLTALFIVIGNFLVYKPNVSLAFNLFCVSLFSLYGFVQDSILISLGWISFPGGGYPFWINSLFIVFIAYYGDIFDRFKNTSKTLLALVGGLGGVMAYWGGTRFESIFISPEYSLHFTAFIFLSWAFFLPWSISMFYGQKLWNKILDASIYYSFDLSGFLRHQKRFDNPLKFSMDKKALITGGTSGIGKAASTILARSGVMTYFTGRNVLSGEATQDIHPRLNFLKLDMVNWDEIDKLCEELPSLDYLVLNAGGMPKDFETNSYGVELQMASQLFGHYFLARRLKELGKLNEGARIVWVSSGGMYLKSLTLEEIFENSRYDKVSTYANVKRAQVELLDWMSKEFPDQIVTGMHPGWVDTPGVKNSIEGFHQKMQGRLRSPDQGTDTILWLLNEKANPISGAFYFDREKVDKNKFWWITNKVKDVDNLAELLRSYYKKLKTI